MKALLLKDFYSLIINQKIMLILIPLFVVASAVIEDFRVFYLSILFILVGTIPVSSISFDERDKWDNYSLTLPFSKAKLVSSKYVFGLLFCLITLVFSLTANTIVMLYKGDTQFDVILGQMVIPLFLCLVSPALEYPFMFAFGAGKGRIFKTVVMLAGMAFLLSCSGVFNEQTSEILEIPEIPTAFYMPVLPMIFVPIALIIYAVSWAVSIALYKRREI